MNNKYYFIPILLIISMVIVSLGCIQQEPETTLESDDNLDIEDTSQNEQITQSEKAIVDEKIELQEQIVSLATNENSPPELKDGVLFYSFEGRNFYYRFQVRYKDQDGDLPRYVFVYINGSRREMIIREDGEPIDPKEGITYILPITQDELYTVAPKVRDGEIEYWFRTNDGYGPVSTGVYTSMAIDGEFMGLDYSSQAMYGSGNGGGGGCSGCG